ncbi:N-terminal amidase [Paracoccidioides lutzii Pb01]|uniref:N-terminal amidase n=1 Tax=Paracoccidioides lutzii (strain ATCC MYA-826 / Pb01) TaxID=502779 RepID=C1H974_PARBA|nr:N-terminal amidase [Paracoccidioides lutzii Pb01]EEH36897.2 N-terminal amidase [Paracoccidioides lutzii Pb01]
MRIATLQLSPRLGDVQGNISRANALVDILEKRLAKFKGETVGGGGRGSVNVAAGAAAGSGAGGLLDVLVLPEMAFSGYNFPSLEAIRPCLESSESGPTAKWAQSTARRLGCVVCVGYPELAGAGTNSHSASLTSPEPSTLEKKQQHSDGLPPKGGNGTATSHVNNKTEINIQPPGHEGRTKSTEGGNKRAITTAFPEDDDNDANGTTNNDDPPRFNSALIVSPTGSTLSNYQKRFLYYTDEPWAAEGRNGKGFLNLRLPFTAPDAPQPTPNSSTSTSTSTTPTAIGICMDINPYKFLAPWTSYEFATHVLASGARLVLLPMAWLTQLGPAELTGGGVEGMPDMETFRYWVSRFWPLLERGGGEEGEGEGEVVVVFANRVGIESGGMKIGEDGDGVARYAGSSCVVGFRRRGGRRRRRRMGEIDGEEGSSDEGSVSGGEVGVRVGKKGAVEEAEIAVWEMLGRAEEGVCLADTELEPKMLFRVSWDGGRG